LVLSSDCVAATEGDDQPVGVIIEQVIGALVLFTKVESGPAYAGGLLCCLKTAVFS
jgi:hypothetical protein